MQDVKAALRLDKVERPGVKATDWLEGSRMGGGDGGTV